MTDGQQTLQDVPVDWEALEDAFENNAPEVHSYLHIQTGEVLRVVDGIADPEMHSRIALDAHYMRIDPVSSREQYRWMERFIPMVTNEQVQGQLTTAIDGKGAFRRFKDVLMSFAEERERWFAFRSERLRVFMEAWMSAHGLNPIARVATEGASEGEVEPPAQMITQEQLGAKGGGGRHTKVPDLLQRQLAEVVENMVAKDVEKVLAFAEFLQARRPLRSFTPRTDSSPLPNPREDGGGGKSAPGGVDDSVAKSMAADEQPPSQRRVTDHR